MEIIYLLLILYKHRSMEGEMRERAVQERKVVGFLGHIMKEWKVNMEVKKGLHNGIIVPTITYARKTWVWNECQRLWIQTVKVCYRRKICGERKMDG